MPTITKVETEIIKPGTAKKIAELKITRDSGGVNVFLKTNIDFSFLYYDPQEGAYERFAGVECFRAKTDTINDIDGYFNARSRGLMYSEIVNMTFLMAKELENGKTFKFKTPISTNTIKQFAICFKKSLTDLFIKYLKQINISIVITSEE